MRGLASLYRILHQPINLPRPLDLDRLITLGSALAVVGIAFFVMAVAWVPTAGIPASAQGAAYNVENVEMARGFFRAAGWFIVGGWLFRRWEAKAWPFNSPKSVWWVKNTLNFIVVAFAILFIAALIMMLMLARINR